MTNSGIIIESVKAFEWVRVVSGAVLFFKCFRELVGDHCVDLLVGLQLTLAVLFPLD